eukprot:1180370-Prorocentrum_minimum.AAC.1
MLPGVPVAEGGAPRCCRRAPAERNAQPARSKQRTRRSTSALQRQSRSRSTLLEPPFRIASHHLAPLGPLER